MAIREPAPAKINLALHVRRRRADGYHELETVFAFAAHGDAVTVELAEEDDFAITGPYAKELGSTVLSPLALSLSKGVLPDEAGGGLRQAQPERGSGDNLVQRAARAFVARFARDAAHRITLDKYLPVASGIGGGSADAAATLRALAHLHRIDDAPALTEIARTLGADVPACLAGRAAFGTGRGDDLRLLPPLGALPALLANPGVALATAPVFAHWDGVDRGALDPGDWRGGRNDLEPPARALAPAIGDVLAALGAHPEATLARMSGSGATCFAIFATPAARDAAAAAIARAHAGWWLMPTTLG